MGTKTGKKVVVTCGLVGLMMFGFIPHGNAGHVDNPFTITAQAAESYSENWKVDSNGDWRFYNNDGSVVSNAWIHDRGEWYLVDGTGTMMTGVFQSNEGKYYLLDTVRGSGTYGKLLTNGKVYSGITLNCDTNPTYEGALSAETINSLKALGIRFDNVQMLPTPST